jgi:hypothetical protein
MKFLDAMKMQLEILGGSRDRDAAFNGKPARYSPWLRGVWWGLLVGGIILFCGQTSKFIYIDF